jgi:hypothetical protein
VAPQGQSTQYSLESGFPEVKQPEWQKVTREEEAEEPDADKKVKQNNE